MNAFLIDTPPLDVFEQMAVDEALALSHPDAFCLRFFRWNGVGLTFGYAQRFQAVEKVLPPGIGTNWTRRPTGGGVVPHLSDLTFSLVFPDPGVLDPMALYERIHSAIQKGLLELALDVQLSGPRGEPAPHGPQGASQCFRKPVRLDLVMGGAKILGGAIRRMGQTVLYQGSLQLPEVRQRAPEFEAALQRQIGAEWNLRWHSAELDAGLQAKAMALEAKYRSPAWIQRR